jgi:arylformamidase
MRKIFDITRTIGKDTIDYPGDTEFCITDETSINKGDDWNLSKIIMTTHYGTHIDLPLHKYKHGKNLDDIPLSDFELECEVIEIKDKEKIALKQVLNKYQPKNGAVFFKTNNSNLNRRKFSKKYVYIEPNTAEYLVNKEIKLVGIDYLSPDPIDSDFPVHKILLSNNVLILEDVFLKNVNVGRYRLFYLPLKIKFGNGVPVRAILKK